MTDFIPHTTASLNGDVSILALREPEWHGVSLKLRLRNSEGTWVARPMELQELQPGYISQPFVRLDMGHAQMLMDQLWTCGLRPTEGSGSAGALAATQAHLDDMRRLCFEFAGVGKAKP